MSRDFNPSRLILARKRRGKTQTALHRETRTISIRSLNAYEAGTQVPSAHSVALIAEKLTMPPSFFYGPTLEEPALDGISFRALSKLTASKRDQAIGSATFALALSDWFHDKVKVPDENLPDLHGIDPETAAEAVRAAWGLGQQPIPNMIRLLERNGVRVFSLAEDYAEVNAFSFWRDGVPFVFLNTRGTGERSRMDAAHELGHLLLHRHHDVPRGREYEHQAEHFAGALLMPRDSVVASVPRGANLTKLVKAKKQWRVSASALAVRMNHLGMMSDWQYRSVFIQLADGGFSKSEPEGIPRESSTLLPKMFAQAKAKGHTKATIAATLEIPVDEVDKILFGLILMDVGGSGRRGGEGRGEPPTQLRLVGD